MDIIVPIYVSDYSLYPVIQRSLESLDNLLFHSDHNDILIDDASPLSVPWEVTHRNERNLGFTAAVNVGLALSKDDVVIVMNDDVVMVQECFDRFKTLEGLQIASPADTASSPDDRFGSCWGMTREVYERLGPLNEEYKHFWSDLDYYHRAKKAGVEIIKWRDIVLEHPESSTYKTLDKESLLKADTETWERNLGRDVTSSTSR